MLTSKFFSYEQTAETLLESISENELRIQQLATKKAVLQDKLRTALNEELIIGNGKDSRGEGEICQQKKEAVLQDINEKNLLN